MHSSTELQKIRKWSFMFNTVTIFKSISMCTWLNLWKESPGLWKVSCTYFSNISSTVSLHITTCSWQWDPSFIYTLDNAKKKWENPLWRRQQPLHMWATVSSSTTSISFMSSATIWAVMTVSGVRIVIAAITAQDSTRRVIFLKV